MPIETTEEKKDVEETEDVEETAEETTTDQETTEETTEKKPAETLEARKARLERQLGQVNKKLGVETERSEKTEKIETKPGKKSNDLDYGQKAFLVANGVKGADETKLVQDVIRETGKTIEQVLESKYFQAELKDMRDLKASTDATPTGSKRSGNAAHDSVEYWIAKGELPPASEVELRRKVVNARMKKESSTGVFYNS